MEINEKFYSYIKPYLTKLQEKIGKDFIVFGSAPLYLIGAVEFSGKINDIDISIKDKSQVPADAQEVTFHKDQNQKFYKIIIDDLEVDMGLCWPACEDSYEKVWSNPVTVDGFNFANLDIVEEWKRKMVIKYDRQKDKDYLEIIKKFREKI